MRLHRREKNPHVIELALEKPDPTPSNTSKTPSDVGVHGSTGISMPTSNAGSTENNATMNSHRVSARNWRILVSTALGRQYLGIPKGTVTEQNAQIQTFGFVPNDLSFATEISFFWSQKNRVSAGVLYNMVNKVSYYNNAPTQRSGEIQYFGRYARHLGVGMFRPYVGWGGIAGVVRGKVGTYEESPIENDTYATTGFFMNIFSGLHICVLSTCQIAAHVEVNFLWKWVDFNHDPMFAAEYAKEVGFWLNAGIAFYF